MLVPVGSQGCDGGIVSGRHFLLQHLRPSPRLVASLQPARGGAWGKGAKPRYTHTNTDKDTDTHTHKQVHTHIHRHTEERQTDREKHRKIHIHTHSVDPSLWCCAQPNMRLLSIVTHPQIGLVCPRPTTDLFVVFPVAPSWYLRAMSLLTVAVTLWAGDTLLHQSLAQ